MSRLRSRPLEVCPFCMPTEWLPDVIVAKPQGPARRTCHVIAAQHRPGCPRGRWCRRCGADLVNNEAFETAAAFFGECRVCELREMAQETPSEAELEARRARRKAERREQEQHALRLLQVRLDDVGPDIAVETPIVALVRLLIGHLAAREAPAWEALIAVSHLGLVRFQHAREEAEEAEEAR